MKPSACLINVARGRPGGRGGPVAGAARRPPRGRRPGRLREGAAGPRRPRVRPAQRRGHPPRRGRHRRDLPQGGRPAPPATSTASPPAWSPSTASTAGTSHELPPEGTPGGRAGGRGRPTALRVAGHRRDVRPRRVRLARHRLPSTRPRRRRASRAQLQAIGNTPATPVVRLPRVDEEQIRLYLDMGALGIMAAFVETPQDAEFGALACRYPPRGIRSFRPPPRRRVRTPDRRVPREGRRPGELHPHHRVGPRRGQHRVPSSPWTASTSPSSGRSTSPTAWRRPSSSRARPSRRPRPRWPRRRRRRASRRAWGSIGGSFDPESLQKAVEDGFQALLVGGDEPLPGRRLPADGGGSAGAGSVAGRWAASGGSLKPSAPGGGAGDGLQDPPGQSNRQRPGGQGRSGG